MHKELEQKLVEQWPQWFNIDGDISDTLMPWGFTHDDGWFEILWRLCADLEPLVGELEQATGLKFEILQVKEKFGVLRIYCNQENDAIRQRLSAAIEESFHTCEVCGEPGILREGSWFKTVCEEHVSEWEARNRE